MGFEVMDLVLLHRSHALRGNAVCDALRYGTRERPEMGYHAERGNDEIASKKKSGATKPANEASKDAIPQNRLREIQFYGSYQNTFDAMAGFANRKFNVIPVSLSMALPEDSSKAASAGVLKWVLKLWI